MSRGRWARSTRRRRCCYGGSWSDAWPRLRKSAMPRRWISRAICGCSATGSKRSHRAADRADAMQPTRWPLVGGDDQRRGGDMLLAWMVWPRAPAVSRFTPLASDSNYQGMPAWSPDGKTIAYVADVDGVRQIFTREPASSKGAPITRARFDCRDPFWSHDSSRVYYLSAAGEKDGIYSVSAAGGPTQPEVTMRTAVHSPRTAPRSPSSARISWQFPPGSGWRRPRAPNRSATRRNCLRRRSCRTLFLDTHPMGRS